MAYFDKKLSLKEMVDHIYGRANVLTRTDRPNMFIKEFNIYIDFLKKKIAECRLAMTKKQENYLLNFVKNLSEGVSHYQLLFSQLTNAFAEMKSEILRDLEVCSQKLLQMRIEIDNQIPLESGFDA